MGDLREALDKGFERTVRRRLGRDTVEETSAFVTAEPGAGHVGRVVLFRKENIKKTSKHGR